MKKTTATTHSEAEFQHSTSELDTTVETSGRSDSLVTLAYHDSIAGCSSRRARGVRRCARLYQLLHGMLGRLAIAKGTTDVKGDPQPDVSLGPIFAPADAPNLHKILQQVAGRFSAPCPCEVRLAYLPACGVLELRPDPKTTKTVLIIGLPCLQIWNTQELRAVLGHEFVHLLLADADFTQQVVKETQEVIHLAEKRGSSLQRWLARRLGAPTLSRAVDICRSMEFRADFLAARAFGANFLVSAMEKLAVVQPVFREVLLRSEENLDAGVNIYRHFANLWTKISPAQFAKLSAKLTCDEGDPLDPHPSLAERLSRLRRLGSGPNIAYRSATELAPNLETLQDLFHNRLFHSALHEASVFQQFRR